jgi:two-component system, LuxR family, secretion system response regulator SsrB
VLDISLPGGQGAETIARLHTVSPPPAVIVLTPTEDPGLVREALTAGTAGYVLMRSGFAALREAVQTVMRGERYVDPALAGRLEEPEGAGRAASARELEVLRRAARGQSHKAIASALAISARTVEAHKRHGMRKLGLHGRRDLLRYAVARHWLAEP